jgi:hypothetical protein
METGSIAELFHFQLTMWEEDSLLVSPIKSVIFLARYCLSRFCVLKLFSSLLMRRRNKQ